MSMLQVRWSLNAATPTKRKTLAADYNPIHKRLRDFGTEAQELDMMPTAAGAKAAAAPPAAPPPEKRVAAPPNPEVPEPPAKAAAKADALGPMQPVTLQSIVAELEGAGLLGLNSVEAPTSPQQQEAADAAAGGAAADKTRQLSLGAAGLLSAAGLLPNMESGSGAPVGSARSASSDAGAEVGAETSVSDTGSSYDGSALDATQAGDRSDTRDSPDPITFLESCGGTSAADAAADGAPPNAVRTESTTSLSSQEIRKHNEDFLRRHAAGGMLWQGVIPGSRQQGIIDPAALDQAEAPGSHSGSPDFSQQQLVPPLPATMQPSLAPLGARSHPALHQLPPLGPSLVGAPPPYGQSAAAHGHPLSMMQSMAPRLSTEVFDELAKELQMSEVVQDGEGDAASQDLLNELQGLCDMDEVEVDGTATAAAVDTTADGTVDASELFMSLDDEGLCEENPAPLGEGELSLVGEGAADTFAPPPPREQGLIVHEQGLVPGQGLLSTDEQGMLATDAQGMFHDHDQGLLSSGSMAPVSSDKASLLSELEALPIDAPSAGPMAPLRFACFDSVVEPASKRPKPAPPKPKSKFQLDATAAEAKRATAAQAGSSAPEPSRLATPPMELRKANDADEPTQHCLGRLRRHGRRWRGDRPHGTTK